MADEVKTDEPEKVVEEPKKMDATDIEEKILKSLVEINDNITTLSSAIDNLKSGTDVPDKNSDDDNKEEKEEQKEDDKKEYDDGVDHEKQLQEIADDLNLGK